MLRIEILEDILPDEGSLLREKVISNCDVIYTALEFQNEEMLKVLVQVLPEILTEAVINSAREMGISEETINMLILESRITYMEYFYNDEYIESLEKETTLLTSLFSFL